VGSRRQCFIWRSVTATQLWYSNSAKGHCGRGARPHDLFGLFQHDQVITGWSCGLCTGSSSTLELALNVGKGLASVYQKSFHWWSSSSPDMEESPASPFFFQGSSGKSGLCPVPRRRELIVLNVCPKDIGHKDGCSVIAEGRGCGEARCG